MAFIEINNLTFNYPNNINAPALDELSLSVEKGQFIVLFGPSGCGKSTLLRLLKKEIQPHGVLSGDILFNGHTLDEEGSGSREVGFVFQDPENQVVADQVLHELAFGLENQGLPTNEMRNRIAEMVHFMGAEHLLHRKTHELSGGQKQQLNLASVLLMQPSVLLLDEPTAQLDPVSSREFLDMIVRLNEEFGLTVIMAEHRLEEVISVADKIVMMDNGRVQIAGNPKQVVNHIWNKADKTYIPSIPSFYLQITKEVDQHHQSVVEDIPLTVKEGKNWLQSQPFIDNGRKSELNKAEEIDMADIVRVNNLFFQYEIGKKAELILKELDFSLRKGEIYTLLGGNGSGKSTLLKVICGIHKPQRGKVYIYEKSLKRWTRNELAKSIGYLPQNPKLFFIQDTLEKELQYTMEQWDIESPYEATTLLESLGISHLRHKHPYDLSGGELQKAALACLLLRKPEILLLDEPTKGLDPVSKKQLGKILIQLQSNGMTVLMTSHDVEFAAKIADRCGMMFEGKITSESEPASFFRGNFFYTTMIQRLLRSTPCEAVTLEEAVQSWKISRN
ncbi:ABC transporter ATP-binding protein [Evansella tamaricis]|uniref:ATP-binding cassette domain-containing protein n=1 Tax=Evansella tamaricis TaxID=2069301 RepID=A0ABS6JEA4_9BACI|nr:ABC transporter ATP-binding protein [Evansella tamaricis]MBU9712007.1 ATP-binding cassette domain-containing protein [Evansella tamaricis]